MRITFETLFKLDRPENFKKIEEFEIQLFHFLGSGELSDDEPPTLSLALKRHLVDRIENLIKIEIFSDEHSPPHFHAKGGNIDASFTIENCDLLNGTINRRELRLIRFWYEKMGKRLVEVWNETRPINCPVGKIISK